MANELKLTARGVTLSGWTEIRVTRGIERCPNDFDIGLTERYPGERRRVSVRPGDSCQVSIDDDVVITGYIDRLESSIAPHQHSIRVVGRGKCQDLVDCSAEWPSGQISGSDVLEIARKLAQPYSISVAADVQTGPPIPQFNLNFGETAFSIIEQVCRFNGLLVYELPDGSLFLSQVGSGRAAGGFTEGINVLSAKSAIHIDERYSNYTGLRQSMDVLGDLGDGGNLLSQASDPGVSRHRLKYIIADFAHGGENIAKRGVLWECSRRLGSSRMVMLRTDSWRDASGGLWAPNTIVPLSLPTLKVEERDWVISEVTYLYREDGTSAELVIVPAQALEPAPLGPPLFLQELEAP